MASVQMAEIYDSDKVIGGLLLCTAFSLFLFNQTTRAMLYQGKFNMSFNLLFICFAALTIGVLLLKEYVDLRVILMTFTFAGVVLITIIASGNNYLSQLLKVTISMVFPFLITGFRLPEPVFESFFGKFLKTANVVCIFLVCVGLCDYISGAKIQTFFAQHRIFDSDFAHLVLLERSYGIYRYYSFIGHPLTTAWYLLMFYALNILYNRYFGKMLNEYLVTLVALIGLLLCGSRTALIIGLFMFVFLNNRKHKVAFMLSLSALSAGLAMTTLFRNNLMQRFMIGMNSGDYSEGRNEALSRVINSYVHQPSFFTGGGVSYSWQVTLGMGGFIKSFEYPFMMFAYDFGILGVILIYALILLIPALICLKNRSYFLLIFFLAILLYMNGQNDIALYTDQMGQFCFFTMIMINMSYLIKRKREVREAI